MHTTQRVLEKMHLKIVLQINKATVASDGKVQKYKKSIDSTHAKQFLNYHIRAAKTVERSSVCVSATYLVKQESCAIAKMTAQCAL